MLHKRNAAHDITKTADPQYLRLTFQLDCIPCHLLIHQISLFPLRGELCANRSNNCKLNASPIAAAAAIAVCVRECMSPAPRQFPWPMLGIRLTLCGFQLWIPRPRLNFQRSVMQISQDRRRREIFADASERGVLAFVIINAWLNFRRRVPPMSCSGTRKIIIFAHKKVAADGFFTRNTHTPDLRRGKQHEWRFFRGGCWQDVILPFMHHMRRNQTCTKERESEL